MQVPVINNSETTFGYRMPKKKTFRAMSGYYKLKNDKSTALEYTFLHNQAKARLHYQRFLQAENELEALSDEIGVNDANLNQTFRLFKILGKMGYEKLASVHYYAKF